jgi:hypothetical protein
MMMRGVDCGYRTANTAAWTFIPLAGDVFFMRQIQE